MRTTKNDSVSKTLNPTNSTFVFSQLNISGKKEWPELVGKNVDEAKAILEQDERKLTIEILDEKSSYDEMYGYSRVRLFHKNNIVTEVPVIG